MDILYRHMDLVLERAQTSHYLLSDLRVLKNNYVVEFDHPAIGKSMWPPTPLTYSETPVSNRKAAPAHGENTEEILIDMLGYTWDDIVELKNEGVIL